MSIRIFYRTMITFQIILRMHPEQSLRWLILRNYQIWTSKFKLFYKKICYAEKYWKKLSSLNNFLFCFSKLHLFEYRMIPKIFYVKILAIIHRQTLHCLHLTYSGNECIVQNLLSFFLHNFFAQPFYYSYTVNWTLSIIQLKGRYI